MAVQRCHGIREETRFFFGSDPGLGFGFPDSVLFGLVWFVLVWFFFKNIFQRGCKKLGKCLGIILFERV